MSINLSQASRGVFPLFLLSQKYPFCITIFGPTQKEQFHVTGGIEITVVLDRHVLLSSAFLGM